VSLDRWVKIERGGDGIVTATMDRPPVNALGKELVQDLTDCFEALQHDASVRCLVLRSAGKHFCAGADLKERLGMTLDDVRAFVPKLAAACNGLARLPFPTIAAVRGVAAGGGCELALGADIRLLSEDARIGLRETALGIIPGAGGTQRLPRLIGSARAKRWIFAAELHPAAAALTDGVADKVMPGGNLDDESQELARTIAANGPVAVRLAKRAIEEGAELPLSSALELEWECYQPTLETSDRVEALTAFAEKRSPRFEGR